MCGEMGTCGEMAICVGKWEMRGERGNGQMWGGEMWGETDGSARERGEGGGGRGEEREKTALNDGLR
jgi:hypothetical protein